MQMESTYVCATLRRDIAHEWTRNAIMQPALFSLCPQPEAAAQILSTQCSDVKNLRNTCISARHFHCYPRYPLLGARGDFLWPTEKSDCVAKECFSDWVRHTCAGDEWGCVWFCTRKVRRFRRRRQFPFNGQAFAFKNASLLFLIAIALLRPRYA